MNVTTNPDEPPALVLFHTIMLRLEKYNSKPIQSKYKDCTGKYKLV